MEEKNRKKKKRKNEKREKGTGRGGARLSRGLPRDIKRGKEDEYFSLEIVEKGGENGTCYFTLWVNKEMKCELHG